MTTKLSKAASILAFVIGAMAIFAGGQVLLGELPDYYVISWLPVYNYTVGLITFVLTAALIWRNSKWAMAAAIATLISHSLVMVILQTSYSEMVASDSIRAMTVRIVTWVVIVALLLIQSRQNSLARLSMATGETA